MPFGHVMEHQNQLFCDWKWLNFTVSASDNLIILTVKCVICRAVRLHQCLCWWFFFSSICNSCRKQNSLELHWTWLTTICGCFYFVTCVGKIARTSNNNKWSKWTIFNLSLHIWLRHLIYDHNNNLINPMFQQVANQLIITYDFCHSIDQCIYLFSLVFLSNDANDLANKMSVSNHKWNTVYLWLIVLIQYFHYHKSERNCLSHFSFFK